MANQLKSFKDKMINQEKSENVMSYLNQFIRKDETDKVINQSDRSVQQFSQKLGDTSVSGFGLSHQQIDVQPDQMQLFAQTARTGGFHTPVNKMTSS